MLSCTFERLLLVTFTVKLVIKGMIDLSKRKLVSDRFKLNFYFICRTETSFANLLKTASLLASPVSPMKP